MKKQATDRQERAALYHRQGMSKARAMKKAGYSERYADRYASAFFNNPVVAELIRREPIKTTMTEEEFDLELLRLSKHADNEATRIKALLLYARKKGYIKGNNDEVDPREQVRKRFENIHTNRFSYR